MLSWTSQPGRFFQISAASEPVAEEVSAPLKGLGNSPTFDSLLAVHRSLKRVDPFFRSLYDSFANQSLGRFPPPRCKCFNVRDLPIVCPQSKSACVLAGLPNSLRLRGRRELRECPGCLLRKDPIISRVPGGRECQDRVDGFGALP